MIKNINDFIKLKKQIDLYNNFLKNKKHKNKIKKLIENQNKNETIYFNKIDKVYKFENLHKKINWFRYYLELYLNDLFLKYENIQNNKINLK